MPRKSLWLQPRFSSGKRMTQDNEDWRARALAAEDAAKRIIKNTKPFVVEAAAMRAVCEAACGVIDNPDNLEALVWLKNAIDQWKEIKREI